MKIAYLRVSTRDQSVDRQKSEILAVHPDVEYFVEETQSGVKKRPKLQKLLGQLRFKDTLIVESFSRISRSTQELLTLLETFKNQEINFISIKESHLTGNGDSATLKLMVTIMAALSEFERDNLLERQKIGIEIRRKSGKNLGRKPVYTRDNDSLLHALELYKRGEHSSNAICRITQISKPTLYKKLKEFNIPLKSI